MNMKSTFICLIKLYFFTFVVSLGPLGFSSNVCTRNCDCGEGKDPALTLFMPVAEAFQKAVLLEKCKLLGFCFGNDALMKGASFDQEGDNSLEFAP